MLRSLQSKLNNIENQFIGNCSLNTFVQHLAFQRSNANFLSFEAIKIEIDWNKSIDHKLIRSLSSIHSFSIELFALIESNSNGSIFIANEQIENISNICVLCAITKSEYIDQIGSRMEFCRVCFCLQLELISCVLFDLNGQNK